MLTEQNVLGNKRRLWYVIVAKEYHENIEPSADVRGNNRMKRAAARR